MGPAGFPARHTSSIGASPLSRIRYLPWRYPENAAPHPRVPVTANSGAGGGGASPPAARIVELIDSGGASEPPSNAGPLAVDAVLLTLAAAGVPAAWRGVRRAADWARARGDRPWRTGSVRLLPYAVPPLLLATLHEVIGWLFGGRDVAWFQVPYLFTSFWAALVAVTLACAVVVSARVVRLLTSSPASYRQAAEPPPESDAHP